MGQAQGVRGHLGCDLGVSRGLEVERKDMAGGEVGVKRDRIKKRS